MTFPKYGDVFYIRLGRHVGMEQAAGRPAIIVSNNFGNEHSEIVEVVYLTTRPKVPLPTHVSIAAQQGIKESIALCEQISTVSKVRLSDKLGHLNEETMNRVRSGMMVSLNIPESFPDSVKGGCSDEESTITEEVCSVVETEQTVQSIATPKEKRESRGWFKGFRHS